jgi:hypothetical protein
MISSPGSGKWVFAVFLSILAAITIGYPHQVFFFLKFVGDLIAINLRPLTENISKHWPFH